MPVKVQAVLGRARMPVGELLHLLEDDEALSSKVDEALTVLREYETREGTQAPN